MWEILVRNSKVVIAIAAILVVAVLVGVFCVHDNTLFGKNEYSADDYGYITRNSILLRTDRMIYEKDDFIVGMLVNLSSHPIEIRSDEPLIYVLSEFGWLPPMGTIWTMLSYPNALERGWVQPGSAVPVIMDFFQVKTFSELPRWRMLEQQYFYNGEEYVVYSNELVFSESSQPSRFQTPPQDLVNTWSIRAEVVEPYVVSLTNNTKTAIWFAPVCFEVEPDYPTDYASHAILQRQSDEGTWQVLRPDRADCEGLSAPIRIGPRRTEQLFVGEGYLPLDELEAGIYRWHLVNYIDPFPECNAQPGCYLSGAHLFTETFEW